MIDKKVKQSKPATRKKKKKKKSVLASYRNRLRWQSTIDEVVYIFKLHLLIRKKKKKEGNHITPFFFSLLSKELHEQTAFKC